MTVLDSINVVVTASDTVRPDKPTYEYTNPYDEDLYATVFFSPHLLATPNGIAELEVAGVDTFKANSEGSLATRSQLPLAANVPIRYQDKIKFRLWADVDLPDQIDGTLFIVLSDTPDQIEPPKNVDLNVLTRLGRVVELFPFRSYHQETVYAGLNMRGHQKLILTLAPTSIFSDNLDYDGDAHIVTQRLEGNLYVAAGQKNATVINGKFGIYIHNLINGVNDMPALGSSSTRIDMTVQNTKFENYHVYDLKFATEKDLHITGTPFSQTRTLQYENTTGSNYQYYYITINTTYADSEYEIYGSNLPDGKGVKIGNTLDALPTDVTTNYRYIRVYHKFKIQTTCAFTTRLGRRRGFFNDALTGLNENLTSLILNSGNKINSLPDLSVTIPSHLGGAAHLSIQIKTQTGAWIDHVTEAELAALITGSQGRAVLSPENIDGLLLPTLPDGLRVKLRAIGGIQTGVSVILT